MKRVGLLFAVATTYATVSAQLFPVLPPSGDMDFAIPLLPINVDKPPQQMAPPAPTRTPTPTLRPTLPPTLQPTLQPTPTPAPTPTPSPTSTQAAAPLTAAPTTTQPSTPSAAVTSEPAPKSRVAETQPPPTSPVVTPAPGVASTGPSSAATTDIRQVALPLSSPTPLPPSPLSLPAQAAATTPAPTTYVPPPIPVATVDSPTFRLAPPVTCDDKVAKTIQTIYTKNRRLFDTCVRDSDYQIFPFSGTLPTASQIRALATTKACTVLSAACVRANLPECDASGISLKAATETLLKVTMDVEHGRSSPDTERFHALHTWRRDSNLAKAAGMPYGDDSALYAEFARDLTDAIAKYTVEVNDDLSITMTGDMFSSGAAVGAVRANEAAVDDGSRDGGGPRVQDITIANPDGKTKSGCASSRGKHGHALAMGLGVSMLAVVLSI